MIVTIEYNQVAVEDRQNKNVEHCVHIFTRQEFENIIECSLKDYESASYEPNRNIFITTNRDNVIGAYKSANENEILKAIEDKKDLIIFETEKELLQNKIFENGVWIDKPKSKEELEQERIAIIREERNKAMLDGVVYRLNGIEYKISLTKNDGDGLIQVKSAFEMGLSSTIIHFENGTKMPINALEFSDFAVWFVYKRNEFFV